MVPYFAIIMVKLQKHLAYTYKDKKHYKHVITIPDSVLNELGWTNGEDLEINATAKGLVFSKSKKKDKMQNAK